MTDHAVETGPAPVGPDRPHRRRYTALLVLPAAALGAVAGTWFGQSRVAAVEDGLRHALAGSEAATATAPSSPGSLPQHDGTDEQIRRVTELRQEVEELRGFPARLAAEEIRRQRLEGELARRVAELRQEVEGLRGLPARLGAEEIRRQRLEGELAAARGDQAATGNRLAAREHERNDALAGLGAARGVLSRAEAERGWLAGRVAELESAVRAGNAAVADRAAQAEQARDELSDAHRTVAKREDALAGEAGARAAGEVQARQAGEELRARTGELADTRADAAEAGQVAAERDRALAAERAGRGAEEAKAREAAGGRDRALAAERQARATLDDRTAELGAAHAAADAERDRTAGALAGSEQQLDAAQAEVRELAATGSDLDDLGPREPGRAAAPQALPRAPTAAREAARTLAAFKDSVSEGGGGRFEFLGEDRIVVRSSMIFPTGEAEIAGDGWAALDDLATRLRRASERLPPGTPWVLRVDGHADDRTVREGSPFASNRHLSAVRASNVVDHLAAAGLPAERMVAAAFGDTRPLAPGTDEEARDRNRRIELRFVTR